MNRRPLGQSEHYCSQESKCDVPECIQFRNIDKRAMKNTYPRRLHSDLRGSSGYSFPEKSKHDEPKSNRFRSIDERPVQPRAFQLNEKERFRIIEEEAEEMMQAHFADWNTTTDAAADITTTNKNQRPDRVTLHKRPVFDEEGNAMMKGRFYDYNTAKEDLDAGPHWCSDNWANEIVQLRFVEWDAISRSDHNYSPDFLRDGNDALRFRFADWASI